MEGVYAFNTETQTAGVYAFNTETQTAALKATGANIDLDAVIAGGCLNKENPRLGKRRLGILATALCIVQYRLHQPTDSMDADGTTSDDKDPPQPSCYLYLQANINTYAYHHCGILGFKYSTHHQKLPDGSKN